METALPGQWVSAQRSPKVLARKPGQTAAQIWTDTKLCKRKTQRPGSQQPRPLQVYVLIWQGKTSGELGNTYEKVSNLGVQCS